ncbi:tryptophan-rich sensory protein [Glaciihabitans arcticus]|uniref:Tryptophan-rich sensory protein n=1 Tax=Glaciihabitans arcticus TaxID=2668039 RepID=A0A4Q9GT89_9MICO|nr:TspO/MBR family protein [Glaciihabitans arcticus]TBN56327.1 tryptophan-rich sensory protein [Glaciihabitans arcticus]
MTTTVNRPSRTRSALVLVAFLAISFGVAAFGSLSTIENVDGWYSTAEKASWNPPNWIFGPVWTLLYTLISVAAWLVWRGGAQTIAPAIARPQRRGSLRPRETSPRQSALALYVIQLVLNAIWTPVFFGAYPFIGAPALWIALVIIVLLDVAVLLTMLAFWPVSRVASWLLVPYWAWVLFATTLNGALAILNS